MATVEQLLDGLAETPRRIAALSGGLGAARLHARPGEDEWSANEVLAHLRACVDMWGRCIAAMLDQDHPTLRAINPTTWITKTDYPRQEFGASLQAFAAQRSELVAVLAALPPEGWSRSATVTGAGKALERTILFYAEWLARHERPHVKQIERILSAAAAMGQSAHPET